MPDPSYTSWPEVSVEGTPLPDALRPRLCRVVVDQHAHLPDMFTLCFDDDERTALGQAGLKIGAGVKVQAKGVGRDGSELLIDGEVTALEAEYARLTTLTVVRGYDRSHRLQRGRRTETYQNVTLSDVARTVAGNANLTIAKIDSSGSTLDHVSQANLSDWDFLKGLAREIGFEVLVREDGFHFAQPVDSSTGPGQGDYGDRDPQQLLYGRDLIEFHPRVSAAEQVKEVKARAWDPVQKQVVIGSATAGTTHASLSTGPADLAGKFGGAAFVVHDRPRADQTDLDAVAQSVAEQIGSVFAEAEGTTLGNPKLRAGTAVSVAEVGDDFAGQYTLSAVRHIFDDDGYRTEFTVSGRQERSLLGLASLGASNGSASAGGPPITGVVIGIVTNNDDPDTRGRVKVKFPWLSDSYESDWVRMTQPGAGPDSGLILLPEVNDEVLCAFEFGDIRRPFVVGALHNGQDKPRLGSGLVDGGKVKRRGLVSRRGHRVVMFDDDSKSGIALISSDGNLRVALDESDKEIRIHCQGKVTIDTETDAITLKSGGDLSIEAQGNLELKGQAGVKVESSAVLEMSGSLIKLN